MATNAYFEEIVTDAAAKQHLHVEVGTTNFAGSGPQMYLRVGEGYVILSHEDAKALCEAVGNVESYFRYSS